MDSSLGTMLRDAFQFITSIILSLLFPLSFLVISRLIVAQYYYYFYLIDLSLLYSATQSQYLLIKLFLHAIPALLYLLLSLVSVASLTHILTGCFATNVVSRPRLYAAWIMLCLLQICVGLGIEGSIAAGVGEDIDPFANAHQERWFLTRAIFFLGLHETMFFWSNIVVKPVVDDTVLGGLVTRRYNRLWAEKAALAMAFGGLWWWRLRDEVESLVAVVDTKRQLFISIGLSDFVGWWLYYLTVTIGMIKVVRGFIWLLYVTFRRRSVVDDTNDSPGNDDGKV